MHPRPPASVLRYALDDFATEDEQENADAHGHGRGHVAVHAGDDASDISGGVCDDGAADGRTCCECFLHMFAD